MPNNESLDFAGYVPAKGEENLYHCVIEQKQFDPATGQRLSHPVLQKFGKKFFESFGIHNLKQQGYTINILHNPNDVKAGSVKKNKVKQREVSKKTK